MCAKIRITVSGVLVFVFWIKTLQFPFDDVLINFVDEFLLLFVYLLFFVLGKLQFFYFFRFFFQFEVQLVICILKLAVQRRNILRDSPLCKIVLIRWFDLLFNLFCVSNLYLLVNEFAIKLFELNLHNSKLIDFSASFL